MENKVTRLELKLKQTVEMYNAACKEALTERQKVVLIESFNILLVCTILMDIYITIFVFL